MDSASSEVADAGGAEASADTGDALAARAKETCRDFKEKFLVVVSPARCGTAPLLLILIDMDAGEQDITEDVIMDVVRILLFSDSILSLTGREKRKKTAKLSGGAPGGRRELRVSRDSKPQNLKGGGYDNLR